MNKAPGQSEPMEPSVRVPKGQPVQLTNPAAYPRRPFEARQSVPVRYRLANGAVSATCYAAIGTATGIFFLLISPSGPGNGEPQAVVFAPCLLLYTLGWIVGLSVRPRRAPPLPAVYLSAFLFWLMSNLITGDVAYLPVQLSALLLAALAILSGNALARYF